METCPDSNRGRLRRGAGLAAIAALLLTVPALAPARASADLPVYDGEMSFPEIQDSTGPEDYSWQVRLDAGQSLKSVDEMGAVVYYDDGVAAFSIDAGPASDVDGADVPTTLGVSDGDVITLTVHHREGNPAKGGAPFRYPIVPGPGYQLGNSPIVTEPGPLPEPDAGTPSPPAELAVVSRCLVPKLVGRTLRGAGRVLRQAGCSVGEVDRLAGIGARSGRVVRQYPTPGVALARSSSVRVTLGALRGSRSLRR